MDLAEACPHHIVGLTGEEDDILQGNFPAEAVVIVENIPVLVGYQQLKFFGVGMDTRFLVKLPGNRIAAGFPCLDSASGVFPGAGKALALGTAGKQNMPLAVVDPYADHQTVFPGIPPGATAVDFAGELAIFKTLKTQAKPLENSHYGQDKLGCSTTTLVGVNKSLAKTCNLAILTTDL